MIVQRVEYHRPRAQEVLLVWGINGWNPVPESQRPAGTQFDKAMKSPMTRDGEMFSLRLTVPEGATIDFGFLTTKSEAGFPLSVWEDAGSQAFQIQATGRPARFESSVTLTQSGRFPAQASHETLAGVTVAFLMAVGLACLLGYLAYARSRPLYVETRGLFYRRKRLPRTVVWCLVLGSFVGAALATEYLLRVISPYGHFGSARELSWTRLGTYDFTTVFAIDPEIGTRPTPADLSYNQWGTLKNTYAKQKTPGVTRLVFIGNTLTRKAALIGPLRTRYGEAGYEYWNAGVSSYNTIQSIRRFLEHSASLSPDHVILTIQPDDVETIPIAFLNDGMQLILYAPNFPLSTSERWWFEHSHIYRLFLGLTSSRRRGEEAILEEMRLNLGQLKDHLQRSKTKLTVLVMPVLCPQELWTDAERSRRSTLMRILNQLDIRTFDLADPILAAIAAGRPINETPGNFLMPSPAAATVIADYLHSHELLEAPTGRS